MKERPILFSAPMVRAILDGRKTQTRRVIKPPFEILSCGGYLTRPDGHGGHFGPYPCPFGQLGQRLWVREAFKTTTSPSPTVLYRADRKDWIPDEGWRPSIHMPRWASRITLEVTAVRVERLQEISGMDAKREGVSPPAHIPQDGADLDWAKREFQRLWHSLNAKRPGSSWFHNPWVWVVEFRRAEAAKRGEVPNA